MTIVKKSPHELISIAEAARRKGVSRQAVYQAAQRGAIDTQTAMDKTGVVVNENFRSWLERGQDWRAGEKRKGDKK